jgi:2-aminomuconate deaminase
MMNETPDITLSKTAPEPVGPYPHARRCGDFVFLSGIGPRQRGSKTIPGVELDERGEIANYDITKQCQSVFENVKLVLKDAGLTLADLVDVTVFLTNMKEDFSTFNRLYGEFFAGCQPTRTTVGVDSLPTPIAIELKCIAAIGAREEV